MKNNILLLILSFPFLVFGQVPSKYDYPDTLWVYGQSNDPDYGTRPEKPIKVGGGILPKHVYRYLNSLIDSLGNKITYERVGSCCSELIKRSEPLTKFILKNGDSEFAIYFDQYEWKEPKLIKGFEWKERRLGYFGEFKNDTIFEGYGIYFFKDGGYYKGNWKNGDMSGEGEMLIPAQEKYIGEFKDGKYHGQGTLFDNNGSKYVGPWVNGKKEGEGKMYFPASSSIEVIEGNYVNDEPKGLFLVTNKDGTQEMHEFQ